MDNDGMNHGNHDRQDTTPASVSIAGLIVFGIIALACIGSCLYAWTTART